MKKNKVIFIILGALIIIAGVIMLVNFKTPPVEPYIVKGTYEKIAESKYVINSGVFDHQTIIYDEVNHSFEIVIKGKTYLFRQISSVPNIINQDAYGD